MEHVSAKRTLVKSPPELWSELSEVDRLARHLEAFGEITITKLEPEHTVAWEGEQTSGTVSIEPSGWGTKVTLTAKVPSEVPAAAPPAPAAESEPAAEPEHAAAPDPEPAEPEPAPPAAPPRKPGFFARLFGLPATAEPGVEQPSPEEQTAEEPAREPHPEPQREPEHEPAPEPEPEPEPATAQAQAVLEDALEALGSAHHRPFSRG